MTIKQRRTLLIIGCIGFVAVAALVSKRSSGGKPDDRRNHILIDVSRHQKEIDWAKVANQGDYAIDGVYIKATEGGTYIDPQYRTNIREAREAGLKVGAYHFFRLSSSAEEQFENFKKNVPREAIDLIPMVDVELDCDCRRYPEISREEIKNRLQEFSRLIESHYHCKPMIYGTMRSYNRYCAPTFNNYHLYIGRYGPQAPVINGEGTYTIWQYSETGHISGISEDVDLCRFNEQYSIEDIIMK